MSGSMVLLSLSQVSKVYSDGRRDVAVLDRVSIEIDAGDFVGVWGPRRSGKSTLLRVLAGVEQPDEGSVILDGHVLGGVSPRARARWLPLLLHRRRRGRARLLRRGGVALVESLGGPVSNETAVRDVALALLPDGLSLRQAEPHARQALRDVGVGKLADMNVERMTLDERVRVGLARALVREPRVLLVDEPAVLSSLRESIALNGLLRSLGARRDVAVVIASEELDPLHGTQRMFTISDGALRAMDRPDAQLLPLREPQPDEARRAS